MVNVDISNVWTCLSLPDLLACEQQVFDAHAAICEPREEGVMMDWLSIPEAAQQRALRRVKEVGELVRETSDVLLVCGSGGTFHGAAAAVGAMQADGPQILFVGQSLWGRQWQAMNEALEGKDYSLLIISADGTSPAVNLTVRSLRWMMERKYADKAKTRTYVATAVGSPYHTMAQEEGYELFPLPREPGGRESVLTAAALVPMAAAGIDPFAVMEGMRQSHRALDLRAFENPVWLYAAAKYLLAGKGRDRELLCLEDHRLQPVGDWLRHCGRMGTGEICVETVLLPGELWATDRLVQQSDRVFETFLSFTSPGQKIPVEMDWKDYDGMGFLSGKHVGFVREQLVQAMQQTHNDMGVPILNVDAGDLNGENLGAMLHFFELATVLTAQMLGHAPLEATVCETRQTAMMGMGAPDIGGD